MVTPGSGQPCLFGDEPWLPDGMRYREAFVSAEEEADLLARLAGLVFEPFQFRGFEARRRVVSFGWRYDFARTRLEPAPDMPAWLAPIRERAEDFAGLASGSLRHLLINEYLPGAPIGWHRDRPSFAEVVGVSLGGPCVFRMRRRTDRGFARTSLTLAPRSAYLLSGEARTAWEHSIPPVAAHRYSLTFRRLRDA